MLECPLNSFLSQLAVLICGAWILLAPWSIASVGSSISHTLECAEEAAEVVRLSKDLAWWKWLAQLLLLIAVFVLSVIGAFVWLCASFLRAAVLGYRAPPASEQAISRAPTEAERKLLVALRNRHHGELPGQ